MNCLPNLFNVQYYRHFRKTCCVRLVCILLHLTKVYLSCVPVGYWTGRSLVTQHLTMNETVLFRFDTHIHTHTHKHTSSPSILPLLTNPPQFFLLLTSSNLNQWYNRNDVFWMWTRCLDQGRNIRIPYTCLLY